MSDALDVFRLFKFKDKAEGESYVDSADHLYTQLRKRMKGADIVLDEKFPYVEFESSLQKLRNDAVSLVVTTAGPTEKAVEDSGTNDEEVEDSSANDEEDEESSMFS